jgi:hypothetical protein
MLGLNVLVLILFLLGARCASGEENPIQLRNDECIKGEHSNPSHQDVHDYWNGPDNDRERVIARCLDHATADMSEEEFFSTLNGRRVEKFFRELEQGQTKHIYVFGGSMTAGRLVGGIHGAWPTLFGHAMNEQLKANGGKIHVHNLAVPATTSEFFLHRIPAYFPHEGETNHSVLGGGQAADMIILDYNVNDCAALSPGGRKPDDVARLRQLGFFEAIVRRLMKLHSNPAIVYYDVAVTHTEAFQMGVNCDEYQSCWQGYEIHTPILHQYAIPAVSQKDALWPRFTYPPPLEYWDCTRSCAHPKNLAHDFMRDFQVAYFKLMLQSVSRRHSEGLGPKEGGVNDEEGKSGSKNLVATTAAAASETAFGATWYEEDHRLEEKMKSSAFKIKQTKEIDDDICDAYVSSLDHASSMHMLRHRDEHGSGVGGRESGEEDAEVKLVHIDSDCWSYGEDVPGKWGWLANATSAKSKCFDASLVFRMKFGKHFMATMTALQTYDMHAGMVEISLSPPLEGDSEIHGKYKHEVKRFKYEGLVDNFYTQAVGDAKVGHSILMPFRVTNERGEAEEIKADSVQYVRLRMVDPNKMPWKGYRKPPEIRGEREYPVRVKIVNIVTC